MTHDTPAARPRIGILVTGHPPDGLAERHGGYGDMVARLLVPDFATTRFDVRAGEWPGDPTAFAGFVVTGSAAGVYDPLPWIAPLKDFLREGRGGARAVGICFGHQVMAEAFGGRVEKSRKGWGLGLHRYTLERPAAWVDGVAAVTSPASHQDQVVRPPDDAVVLGGNAFTPFGMLAYPARRAASFQFHPEFSHAFAAELVERRRLVLPDGEADRAVASLREAGEGPRVGGWIRRFLAG